jgi:D-arabinose 1-dehydrogenase-like Zn-dependent alcohol dehydrogenase
MNIIPGDTVAIQGLGGLGHLALQYARRMGYRTVALSTSSDKRDFALELGANDFIDTSKENAVEALKTMGGASLIVVTAPNPQTMGPLIHGLAPMGKLLTLAGKSLGLESEFGSSRSGVVWGFMLTVCCGSCW